MVKGIEVRRSSRRFRAVLAGCWIAAGCAGPPAAPAQPARDVEAEILERRAGAGSSLWTPDSLPTPGPLGVEPPSDLPLARLDGEVIRAADVFAHLYFSAHAQTVESVKQTLIHRLVERESARLGVELPAEVFATEVADVFEQHRRQVQAITQGSMTLEEYVAETYRLPYERFEEWVREDLRRTMLAHRLVLVTLLREPRLQFRIIQTADRSLAEQILDKLKRGADFGVLAREHSEDAAAPMGGLYPALPTTLDYPLVARALDLEDGGFDEIREVQTQKGLRYRILQLMARMDADDDPFDLLLDKVEKELEGRNISALELDAWMRIMENRYALQILPVDFL
jgi:hypothetical protein